MIGTMAGAGRERITLAGWWILSATLTLGGCDTPSYSLLEHVEEAHADFEGALYPAFVEPPSPTALVSLPGDERIALTPPFPSRMTFAVSLPEAAFLDISPALVMQPLVRRAQLEFLVSIEAKGKRSLVFSEEYGVDQSNLWRDRRIDLTDWSGQDVSIVLETRPLLARGNALWADRLQTSWGAPMVVSSHSTLAVGTAIDWFTAAREWLLVQAAAVGVSAEDTELTWDFTLHLVLGGLIGLFIRELYKRYGRYGRYGTVASSGREFAGMFPLFTMATITVIAVVRLSFALSLGLIAALTIVRFRGPVKGPEELVYLLFCVSVGLALGAGQALLAVVATSLVALFIVLGSVANRPASKRNLLLTLAGEAKHFFPSAGISGLDRWRSITPFTLQRLEHHGENVEVRGLITVRSPEDTEDVLNALRKELPEFRLWSADVDDVDTSGSLSMNHRQTNTSPSVSGRPFEIIDAPGVRQGVDMSRREVKFALTHADSTKVRSILEVNCQRIVHHGPFSTVYTIYFDDARLSACRENLDGVPRRAKVRLRWYDDGDEEGSLFFEIKRRVDSMVYKERWAIRSSLALVKMTYQEILAELQRVLPASAQEMLLARSEAVLMSQYRREYFRAPGSLTRVTLDEGIISYSQMGLRRPAKRFGTEDHELLILEAKLPVSGGGELRELLHPLEPYVTKSSKYVQACLRLGLLDRTAAAR